MQLGGVEIAFMSAEFFGAIMLFLGFTGIIWLPITWITLSLLTPKILVETYFKEPHFSKFELGALSVFPGTLMRSGIFMRSVTEETVSWRAFLILSRHGLAGHPRYLFFSQ